VTYNPSQFDSDADGIGDACAPTCVTLFRGGLGAVEDTQIADDKPTKNYGSALNFVSGGVPPGQRQALIRFDLTTLGPSLQITSAKLNLIRASSTGVALVRGHRVTSPWLESTVTWSSFAGSYDPAVVVSFMTNQPSSALDVTAAAQAWASTPAGNFGLLFEQDPTFVTSYRSSENPLPRPSLTVCYVVSECGPDGQACDDGDPCTTTSTCQAGVCVGGAAVTCGATATCHVAGTCNPATGACSAPAVSADWTPCDDGDATTSLEVCVSGVCTPTATCNDGNQNQGETDIDCDGPCAPCPCPHDVCVFGARIGFSCNQCTVDICQVDTYCCHVFWDEVCESEVF
jgi:hypothetical protein